MSSSLEQGLLSPSDVAHMAGVSRGAVSNWRKRDLDFPQQVAGTAAKPLFSRQEVTAWLEARGHQAKQVAGEAVAVWAAMNLLRGQLAVEQAIDLLLTLLVARKTALRVGREWRSIDPATRWEEIDRVGAWRAIDRSILWRVQEAIDQVAVDQLGPVADFALERLARSQGKGGAEYGFIGSRTTTMLARLAASRPGGVLYDPACGIGAALLESVSRGAQPKRIVGHDINQRALQIATQRADLHDVPVEFAHADVLSNDVAPGLRADAIILEPPFGTSFDVPSRLMDPRFEFGTPPRSSADTAWLQHVVAHLAESGRGYVLTTPRTLFRGGQEGKIRAELLGRGCVEAIVGLPGKLLPHTSIPLALWVLRRPRPATAAAPILFIDASETEAPEERVAAWLNDAAARQDVPHSEVSVADVLAAESMLTPQRWVGQPEPEPADVTDAYAQGWAGINRALFQLQNTVASFNQPTRFTKSRVMTVDELVEQGVLDLRIGRPKERYAGTGPDLLARVATAADVRDGTLRTGDFDGDYDEYPELTSEGDVLVTTMNTVRARVDEVGGHLPSTGVHRLRILGRGLLSPGYLAIALTGNWNERFQTGTTIQRASIRDLEIPLVSNEDQRIIQQAVTSLGLLRQAAARLADQAANASDSLLDAVRYNAALTIPAAGSVGADQQDGRDDVEGAR